MNCRFKDKPLFENNPVASQMPRDDLANTAATVVSVVMKIFSLLNLVLLLILGRMCIQFELVCLPDM